MQGEGDYMVQERTNDESKTTLLLGAGSRPQLPQLPPLVHKFLILHLITRGNINRIYRFKRSRTCTITILFVTGK